MYVLDAPGNEWITECDVLTHDYHSYGLESTKIAMQASKDKAANAAVARSLLPNLREIFLPSHGVGHKPVVTYGTVNRSHMFESVQPRGIGLARVSLHVHVHHGVLCLLPDI
jgi:hypothetical protein